MLEVASHFSFRSTTPARSLLNSFEHQAHPPDRAIEVLRPVGRVAFYKFDDQEKTLQPVSRLSGRSHKI